MKMAIINWSICDDAEFLCTSFKMGFKSNPDFCFVGESHDSTACLQMVREKKPDILLLDIQMETDTAGIDVIPFLKELQPSLKIIMLTNYDDENYIFKAFANGADNYIPKTLPNDLILDVIKDVYNNTAMLRPEIGKKLAKKSLDINNQNKSILYIIDIMAKLSNSEFEILKAIYSGNSYQKIADDRFVDISTVRSFVSRILKKFSVINMKSLIKDLSKLEVFDLFDK